MRIPRPRLNLIELAMIAALIAVVAYWGGRHRTEVRLQPFLSSGGLELKALERRYGPSRNSEHGEEWIIRDFFKNQRNGLFIDVGANHYQRYSNTYYLETQLGWSGIAIEPQSKFAQDYASFRPRTTFVPLFVSNVSNQEAVLYVPDNDLVASSDRAFAETDDRADIEPIRANTTTLNDVLARSGITAIDFLSIDVELHEPQVLSGFAIEEFSPRLVAVEAHPQVREFVLEYFAAHGYVVIGRYLRADTVNLWFAPIAPQSVRSASRR